MKLSLKKKERKREGTAATLNIHVSGFKKLKRKLNGNDSHGAFVGKLYY
jgi:hypothetical protein